MQVHSPTVCGIIRIAVNHAMLNEELLAWQKHRQLNKELGELYACTIIFKDLSVVQVALRNEELQQLGKISAPFMAEEDWYQVIAGCVRPAMVLVLADHLNDEPTLFQIKARSLMQQILDDMREQSWPHCDKLASILDMNNDNFLLNLRRAVVLWKECDDRRKRKEQRKDRKDRHEYLRRLGKEAFPPVDIGPWRDDEPDDLHL